MSKESSEERRIEGKEKREEPNFSYKEAAEILGVDRTTVSHAVSNEKIKTVDTGGPWDRIPASEIVKYAVKSKGKDPDEIRDRFHERTELSDVDIARSVTTALSLGFLLIMLEESDMDVEDFIEKVKG